MHDADLEKVLRRYRLVDPPSSLATRIAASRISSDHGHVWGAIAAAAVAAVWVAAHAAATEPVSDPIRERDVAAVAAALGGGEEMRQYAEQVVPRSETSLESALEMSW
jgi:hypothetical protein